MPAIADVAAQLAADNLPVIFVDTCILLDLIRAIKRHNADCVARAIDLHATAASTPPQCRIVVSHIVHHEWTEHEAELLVEANRNLTDMERHSAHFHDVCGALGIKVAFAHAGYTHHHVAEQLRDLAARLLHSAIQVDADEACSHRAVNRVLYHIPPSKKGGEAKDCTILEEYLAVCQALQAAGFGRKRVFCTSNTNDYGEAGALHPLLAPDFAAVDLNFTTNLNWGLHDLMH